MRTLPPTPLVTLLRDLRQTNAGGTLNGGRFFVGAHARDGNDHIIYNAPNGWLIYDTNGNAAGGEHHFATVAAHLPMSASDFLIV